MHARTKIRQAFVELLQGRTWVGNKVYEEVATSTITLPRSQDRNVKIVVECYVKATKGVNITVDNIAANVERDCLLG